MQKDRPQAAMKGRIFIGQTHICRQYRPYSATDTTQSYGNSHAHASLPSNKAERRYVLVVHPVRSNHANAEAA